MINCGHTYKHLANEEPLFRRNRLGHFYQRLAGSRCVLCQKALEHEQSLQLGLTKVKLAFNDLPEDVEFLLIDRPIRCRNDNTELQQIRRTLVGG